jgi:hypothetical protein
MKTQISRWTDTPGKRRSGIYQQQGRMISDADLNELMELLKRRVDEALLDVVGSGTPRAADVGLVANGPILRQGPLYAGGVRAALESVPPGAATFALNEQADFPQPPAWTGGDQMLYADVWELATTALQDATLLDPGLHGADTCTRTQTMAQVKWCATATDPLTDAKNPAKGDAPLQLEIREGSSEPDPCDPCAAAVALDSRIGNYLFRLEVHDVQGAANAPAEITLKWSNENGAEQHAQADVPSDYKRGDWIYEFYNDTTERHLGVHLVGGFVPARAVLKDSWPAAADLPDKTQYPYVRRWDGCGILVKSGATWTIKSVSGVLQARDKGRVFELFPGSGTPTHGHYTLGAQLVAWLAGLKFTLALDGRKFVAGDYWLATVRENAEGVARVQLAQPEPVGIVHHYIALARVVGTLVQPLSDADTRRLSFPRLSNLTADRIGYDPATTPAVLVRWSDVIDDATVAPPLNVQRAIDLLIEKLESTDIGYVRPTCAGVLTSVNNLFTWPAGPLTVKSVFDTLLCQLDGTKIPYDAVTGTTTIKQALVALDTAKVNRSGDTMTGSLLIATGGLHVGGTADPGDNNLLVDGNCIVDGNLTVKGTTTTINTTELNIEDNIITVNAAEAGGATAATAGLEVQRATPGTQAHLIWRETEARWSMGVAGQTREISVSTSSPDYTLLVNGGRIGQLDSGTFGTGKWAAIGVPSIGFQPTNGTYYGLKVQWDSDAVVFGLKDMGADRKDAIISWGDNPSDNFRFLRPNDVDAMVITGAGNIGIGTDQPQGRLDVKTPWGDWLFLRQERNTEGNGGFHIHNAWKNSDGPERNRLEIGYTKADGSTSWGQFVLHGPTGNVGIGAPTPDEKLEIGGNLKLTGRILQEDWQAPALLNGWVNYANGFNPAGYFLDKNGVVHLRGLVRSGAAGSVIFTLQVGYRPENRELFIVMANSERARCDVLNNGTVVAVTGSSTWFSLDGITFRAAQPSLVFIPPVVVFDTPVLVGGGLLVNP